jgi:hypothetical protein
MDSRVEIEKFAPKKWLSAWKSKILRQKKRFPRRNRKFCSKKTPANAENENFAAKKSISTPHPKILAQKNRLQNRPQMNLPAIPFKVGLIRQNLIRKFSLPK